MDKIGLKTGGVRKPDSQVRTGVNLIFRSQRGSKGEARRTWEVGGEGQGG